MQRQRKTWRADRGGQAIASLAAIRDAVRRLDDEDLLDLQDIFRNASGTPMMDLIGEELARRDLAAPAAPADADDDEPVATD